jgi:hypothetical protein
MAVWVGLYGSGEARKAPPTRQSTDARATAEQLRNQARTQRQRCMASVHLCYSSWPAPNQVRFRIVLPFQAFSSPPGIERLLARSLSPIKLYLGILRSPEAHCWTAYWPPQVFAAGKRRQSPVQARQPNKPSRPRPVRPKLMLRKTSLHGHSIFQKTATARAK